MVLSRRTRLVAKDEAHIVRIIVLHADTCKVNPLTGAYLSASMVGQTLHQAHEATPFGHGDLSSLHVDVQRWHRIHDLHIRTAS